jgi:large subunit ribosomal protein L7/L12
MNVNMNNKISNLILDIKNLSLLELNELVSQIILEFQINLENNSNKSTEILDFKSNTQKKISLLIEEIPYEKKISVLKSIRTITGLGLKESKELIDTLPCIVKENVELSSVSDIVKDLETAGAKVKIQELI